MKLNDTYFNILVSYAYLQKQKDFKDIAINSSIRGEANIMIDSGAFTLFNAKSNKSNITIDNYCHFLEQYADKVEKYVMLDVIGDHHKSKLNYELMLNRGFNPMFVFTMADKDFTYLKHAVKNNSNICVAGGVTNKGDWIVKRFQDVYNKTNAKIHGLGYVTYPNIYKLPLHSVDSSSWLQASLVYGSLPYFNNGLKYLSYKDILTKKQKLPLQVIQLLEKFKITPKIFSDLNSHRGSRSILFMMSIIANIEYQKYSKIQGIDLFLATCNLSQISALLYVNEQYNSGTLTYENFKKI